jgi:hypothetical protein
MKIAVILSTVIVLFSGSSFAQMGFGAEIGLNGGDDMVKAAGSKRNVDVKYGLRAGVLTDLALTDNFYFQPGIYYASNGYKYNYAGGFGEYAFNQLEIPLYILYKIGPLGANRISIGAGPYVGFNIGGNVKVHSQVGSAPAYESTRDLNVGSGVVNDIKVFDAGQYVAYCQY